MFPDWTLWMNPSGHFYFHVPMWFGMIAMFLISVIYAIKHLRNPSIESTFYSVEFAHWVLMYGLWNCYLEWSGQTTRGSLWHGDVKQICQPFTCWFILVFHFEKLYSNDEQRSRLSAVYKYPLWLWIPAHLHHSAHDQVPCIPAAVGNLTV